MTTVQGAGSLTSEGAVSDVVLRYLDQGIALPGDFYTDSDLFRRELTAIFGRQWVYAGHVSQISRPGDFLTVELGGESCIVVRDRTGQVHGLLNVCRHRGARLIAEPCGSATRFTCPYHQWTYRHDGTLAGAPRMPKDFDTAHFPLKRVHTAVWEGLVFVNFADGEVEDVVALLEPSRELMAPFDIASARIAHTETYEVAANWKLVWENSQECYHCSANHPEFVRTFDNGRFIQTLGVQPVRAFADDERMRCSTFPLKQGARSLSMTGDPVSEKLLGSFGDGLTPYTASTHLKPSCAVVFSPDYGIVFTDIPVAVDRTSVRVQWLVHEDAREGTDYDVANLIRVWDSTNRQDWDLCRAVQNGVRSRGFVPGPLSLDEDSVAAFYYAYARMMSAAGH